jgi:hypothetical protein
MRRRRGIPIKGKSDKHAPGPSNFTANGLYCLSIVFATSNTQPETRMASPSMQKSALNGRGV